MPEIICDTGFLMHMASGRVREDCYTGGAASYLVPDVVLAELEGLAKNPAKGHDAAGALRLARSMRTVHLGAKYADTAIIEYVKDFGGIVATTDKRLKRAVKDAGGSVVSLHGNSAVLE